LVVVDNSCDEWVGPPLPVVGSKGLGNSHLVFHMGFHSSRVVLVMGSMGHDKGYMEDSMVVVGNILVGRWVVIPRGPFSCSKEVDNMVVG
jgi:hypothetical protein